MSIVKDALAYVRDRLQNELSSNLTYHNYDHTYRVYKAAEQLAEEAGLPEDEKEILLLAALFHDTGFIFQAQDHEQFSKDVASLYLDEKDYPSSKLDKVLACIDATKLGSKTSYYTARLLQDADMSGLGREEFLEFTERLRKEENARSVSSMSKKEWLFENIDFLASWTYKTDEGKRLFGAQKEENQRLLKEKWQSIAQKKSTSKDAINNNKNAQTQFKTALRNHIDLSNIADNKANIMISVNALILTVALPFLIDRSMDDSRFWISTIILAAVCLVSMIFATLATRPIQMNGLTTMDQVKTNNSNLFFFGNYYKMPLKDYSTMMKEVLKDDDKLDDSIIADLYFLGKSLGKKFAHLRWCYNMFMYGIVAAVLSLFIVFAIA